MKAPSLRELKSMSNEELVSAYDTHAQGTQVGTSFLLDEIRYREMADLNAKVVSLTKWITFLTVVITLATIVNVIVFLNDSPTVPGFLQ